MTVEEWEAVDKSPGTRFRTPDGKVGRLVSVHKDGATLDFTDENDYRHVTRGFYRCVQLSDPDAPPPVTPPELKGNSSELKKKAIPYAKRVMRVKTGVVYKTVEEAAKILHMSHITIRNSAGLGIAPKKGKYAGESFRFV